MPEKSECPNCGAILTVNIKENLIECKLCGYAEETNGKKHRGEYIR